MLKLNCVRPLELEAVRCAARETGGLLIAEECAAAGCIGEQIACALMREGTMPRSFTMLNLGDQFIPHGTVPQLRRLCGIDGESITKKALEVLRNG